MDVGMTLVAIVFVAWVQVRCEEYLHKQHQESRRWE